MTVPALMRRRMGQGHNLNIVLWMSEVYPVKILCVTFFSNSSWSNGYGSSKVPCKSTLYCHFCPAKWQIFKLGKGDSPTIHPFSFVPGYALGCFTPMHLFRVTPLNLMKMAFYMAKMCPFYKENDRWVKMVGQWYACENLQQILIFSSYPVEEKGVKPPWPFLLQSC